MATGLQRAQKACQDNKGKSTVTSYENCDCQSLLNCLDNVKLPKVYSIFRDGFHVSWLKIVHSTSAIKNYLKHTYIKS